MGRIWNRCIASIVSVTLAAGLCVLPAGAEEPGEITVDGNTVYANGVSILIQKAEDGKAYDYNDDGPVRRPDYVVTGGTTIYGGSKNADVPGDTHVVVDDVRVGTVYGGGYSDGTASADVAGDTYVSVKGKVIAETYGGGFAEGKNGDAQADVSGTAYSITPSMVDRPESGFTDEGHTIHGGGRAYAAGEFSAQANVGNVVVESGGPIYKLYGGGYSSSAKGAGAIADCAAISLTVEDGDVREIYSAGYASGSGARANADAVEVSAFRTEVMTLVGGGEAYSGAEACVSGGVELYLADSPNLYGYIYGGGAAYTGSRATTGNTHIKLENCLMPVDEGMFGLEAASVYGGGMAYGAGSVADTGDTLVELTGGSCAGQVYGGGEASTGGSADSGAARVSLTDVAGTDFEDETYALTLYAGGCSDGKEGSSAGTGGTAEIALRDSMVETVMARECARGPAELAGAVSTLTVGTGVTGLTAVACVNALELAEPLSLTQFLAPEGGTALKALGDGWTEGDVIVRYTHSENDAEPGWFTAAGGTLAFSLTGDEAVWTYTPEPEPEPVPEPDPRPVEGEGGGTSTEKHTETDGDVTVETTTQTRTSGTTTTVTSTAVATNGATGEVTSTRTVEIADRATGVTTRARTETAADGRVTASATTAAAAAAEVKDGAAAASVDARTAGELVKQAKAAAKAADGADAASTEVRITARLPEGQRADSVAVTLPKSAVEALARETAAAVTVDTPVAAVTLPGAALAALAEQPGKAVEVRAARGADGVLTVTAAVDGAAAETLPGGLVAAIPAAEASSGLVAVLVGPDGTEEVVRKSAAVGGALRVPLAGSAAVRLADRSRTFDDAAQADWAEDAVAFVTARGLFQGVDGNRFAPELPMTRGMLVTVLNRLENEPDGPGNAPYADVSADAYYAGAVDWAAGLGIAAGTGAGFAPHENVTRGQLAVFFRRYLSAVGVESVPADSGADPSDWAAGSMAWAVEAGILTGRENGVLDSSAAATRAEVAVALQRLVEYMV